MGLLSMEFSISSTLAYEEVSSDGVEASTFRDRGMSVPATAFSPMAECSGSQL